MSRSRAPARPRRSRSWCCRGAALVALLIGPASPGCTGGPAFDICHGDQCAATTAADDGQIYRSVGPGNTSPLASGAGNPLSIVGSTARFSLALPAGVGVGDVIAYDTNGDGTGDAVAFVHRRASATSFTVRDAAGSTPAPSTAGTTSWSVLRAYTSLADALVCRENTGLPVGLADFDVGTGGRDLVSSNRQWNIACYADAVDTAPAVVCDRRYAAECANGWSTSSSNHLRVFAPRSASEVGVSQQHEGRWGAGYRRTAGIEVYAGHVTLDGIAIRQEKDYFSDVVFSIRATGLWGDVRIANAFAWAAGPTGCQNAFHFVSSPRVGSEKARISVRNSVGINDSDCGMGFFDDADLATIYIANCTGFARGDDAFSAGPSNNAFLENCIGLGTPPHSGFMGASWGALSSSASDDDSAALHGDSSCVGGQAFSFVDLANRDLHLAATDAGARGRGVNLSQDPDLAFSDDIDGDPRPPAPSAWDIGADQAD